MYDKNFYMLWYIYASVNNIYLWREKKKNAYIKEFERITSTVSVIELLNGLSVVTGG